MAARRRGGAGAGTAGSGNGAGGRHARLHTQRSGDGSGGGELAAPSASAGASAAMTARRGRGCASRRPRRAASTLVVVAAAAAAAAPDRAKRRQRGAPAAKASIEGAGGEGGNGGGTWKDSVLRRRGGGHGSCHPTSPAAARGSEKCWAADEERASRAPAAPDPLASMVADSGRAGAVALSHVAPRLQKPGGVEQTPCNWVKYTMARRAAAAPSRVQRGLFRGRRCVVRGEPLATAQAAVGALSTSRA